MKQETQYDPVMVTQIVDTMRLKIVNKLSRAATWSRHQAISRVDEAVKEFQGELLDELINNMKAEHDNEAILRDIPWHNPRSE